MILAGQSAPFAHLAPGSLSVKGGESYTASDEVTVTWKMAHAHTITHFIYFRPDSQTDWTVVDSVKGQQGKLDYSYIWKVPDLACENAQLRIFLPEFSKTPSAKNDDFTLISEPFSIVLPVVSVAVPRHRRGVRRNITANQAAPVSVQLDGRLADRQRQPTGRFPRQLIVNRFR